MFLNAFALSSFHTKLNLLVADSRGRKGVHNWARFGINLFKWWIDPIKLFSCLKVFGCCRLTIASVFFCIGVVPYSLITNPSHSTSLHPIFHLSTEMAMFSVSNLSRTSVSFSMCCSFVPCEMINIIQKCELVFFFIECKILSFLKLRGHIGEPVETCLELVSSRCSTTKYAEVTLLTCFFIVGVDYTRSVDLLWKKYRPRLICSFLSRLC